MNLEHKDNAVWVICCVMVAEKTRYIAHPRHTWPPVQCDDVEKILRKRLAYRSRMHGRISEAVG